MRGERAVEFVIVALRGAVHERQRWWWFHWPAVREKRVWAIRQWRGSLTRRNGCSERARAQTRSPAAMTAALNEPDCGQPMDDQTAIDVCERDKYSGDHREHRDGDGYTPKESPIEHAATLASPDSQRNRHHLGPSSCLGGGPAADVTRSRNRPAASSGWWRPADDSSQSWL